MTATFAAWWRTTGRCLDPDTADVDWHSKREGLAEAAFLAGVLAEREACAGLADPKHWAVSPIASYYAGGRDAADTIQKAIRARSTP